MISNPNLIKIKAKRMFYEAASDIEDLLVQLSREGSTYFAEKKSNTLEHTMHHLACFAAGLYGHAAMEVQNDNSERWMDLAKEIINTCHESYIRAETKLGPDVMKFTDSVEARGIKEGDKKFIQRPEVVESYFILWRLTKDTKYRDWGWEVVEALDKHTKTDAGYAGIKDVYKVISKYST